MNWNEFYTKNKKIINVMIIIWAVGLILILAFSLFNSPQACRFNDWCNPLLYDCGSIRYDMIGCEKMYGLGFQEALLPMGVWILSFFFIISLWYSLARIKK